MTQDEKGLHDAASFLLHLLFRITLFRPPIILPFIKIAIEIGTVFFPRL
jgi:hypothetical protein